MKQCVSCGQMIDDASRFCTKCGASQEVARMTEVQVDEAQSAPVEQLHEPVLGAYTGKPVDQFGVTFDVEKVRSTLTKARHVWAGRVVKLCGLFLLLSLFLPWFSYSYYTSSYALAGEVNMSILDFLAQLFSLGLGLKGFIEVIGNIAAVIAVFVGLVLERRNNKHATAVLVVALFVAFFCSDMLASEAGAVIAEIDGSRYLCLMEAGAGVALMQIASIVAIAAIIIDRLGFAESIRVASRKVREDAADDWGFIQSELDRERKAGTKEPKKQPKRTGLRKAKK